MRLMVNGEAWALHFRHQNTRTLRARWTHAWLHRGGCVLSDGDGAPKQCVIQTEDAASFDFPTSVLRRRAAFVHGNPVMIRERWTMPFSRTVGRREAFTRLLLKTFPTRGPGDDKTTRSAFWVAYWYAIKASRAASVAKKEG